MPTKKCEDSHNESLIIHYLLQVTCSLQYNLFVINKRIIILFLQYVRYPKKHEKHMQTQLTGVGVNPCQHIYDQVLHQEKAANIAAITHAFPSHWIYPWLYQTGFLSHSPAALTPACAAARWPLKNFH